MRTACEKTRGPTEVPAAKGPQRRQALDLLQTDDIGVELLDGDSRDLAAI
jgi:hypothetical protein